MMNPQSRWFASAVSLVLAAFPVCAAAQQGQTAAPYSWHPVKIGGGGYVPGVIYHPGQRGLMYVRTDIGGAYRRDADTAPWLPLTDWVGAENKSILGVESVAIDRTNVQRLYLAVGQSRANHGELLRSEDQGRTFEHVALPFKVGSNDEGRGSGERLVVDPANSDVLLLGTRHDGLWQSVDRGSQWTRLTGFPAIADNGVGVISETFVPGATVPLQGVSSAVSRSIYAAVSAHDAGLFRSDDGGQSWAAVARQPKGLLVTNMRLAANGVLYLT